MRMLFMAAGSAACLAQPAPAQDAKIETLLLGLTEEAESFHNLEETIRTASPDKLFALYNRLSQFSDDRPDLVDIAIDAGLKSGDRAVRSRALWTLLERASVLTMEVDYSNEAEFYPNSAAVKKSVGGVVALNLFEKSAATRTVSLVPGSADGNGNSLSLSGTRMAFKLVAGRALYSGYLELGEDGNTMSGRVDFQDNSNAPIHNFPVSLRFF